MTTDPTVPDAAVQTAIDGLCYAQRLIELGDYARAVVAALAANGWLHDPATVNCGEGHDPTRICCAHAKDVKQLRARVAELEAENARLRAPASNHNRVACPGGCGKRIAVLRASARLAVHGGPGGGACPASGKTLDEFTAAR